MPAMLYNTLNLHYQIKLRDYMKKSRKAAKALYFYLKVVPIFFKQNASYFDTVFIGVSYLSTL